MDQDGRNGRGETLDGIMMKYDRVTKLSDYNLAVSWCRRVRVVISEPWNARGVLGLPPLVVM